MLTETEELFDKGVRAAEKGNWLSALSFFEKMPQPEGKPARNSYLAVCIAKERGQFNKAVTLCTEAVEQEPENPVHYLNLGRVYLFRGSKEEALDAFRKGLAHGREQRIINELERLGTRKKPLIPFLERDNPLNKYLGILLKRIGLR